MEPLILGLAVLITSQPSLETEYFSPWIRCTIKEIMKVYALLGMLMRVERRTTFGMTGRLRNLSPEAVARQIDPICTPRLMIIERTLAAHSGGYFALARLG